MRSRSERQLRVACLHTQGGNTHGYCCLRCDSQSVCKKYKINFECPALLPFRIQSGALFLMAIHTTLEFAAVAFSFHDAPHIRIRQSGKFLEMGLPIRRNWDDQFSEGDFWTDNNFQGGEK